MECIYAMCHSIKRTNTPKIKKMFKKAVASDVFCGVFLCCPFSHEMSLMRSGTSLSQFLRVFLPTLF